MANNQWLNSLLEAQLELLETQLELLEAQLEYVGYVWFVWNGKGIGGPMFVGRSVMDGHPPIGMISYLG